MSPRIIVATALLFLIPVFVVPFDIVPLQFSKIVLAVGFIVILVLLSIFRVLRQGSVSVLWSPLVVSLAVLPIAYLAASIFSSNLMLSLFGYQLETDTFGFVLFGAALAVSMAGALSTRGRVFTALLALLASAGIVFLFQFAQLFLHAPFAVAGLKEVTANLVGSWTDLGLFAGLIASLIVLALAALPLSALHRWVMIAVLALALWFLVMAAVTEAWILTGIVAFITLTYSLARRYLRIGVSEESGGAMAMGASLTVLLASIFFVFVGSGLATSLQSTFGVNTLEVRPSFEATLTVLENVYQKSPIVGSGPNTFANEWLLYRPTGVLTTLFWNVEFTVGSGTIPTALVTGGIVVGLAWLFFTGALLYTTVRALFMTPASGGQSYFLIVATGIASLYLLVVHIVHAPGAILSLLLFAMVGLFMASVSATPLMHVRTISFSASPRAGFAVVLLAIIMAIGSLAFAYWVGKSYASSVYYGQAIVASSAGNLDAATSLLGRAAALNAEDRYYRSLGLIDIARMNAIVQSGVTDREAQQGFQNALASAIRNTTQAIALGPARFDNVFVRAAVYASVVPLGIDGAYENAKSTLDEARAVNPNGPDVDLRLAQVEFARGNTEAARAAIVVALQKKADYTDAILTRAQIELSARNLGKAIESVKAAVYFEPQNAVLLYQLGILLLEDRSYRDAATAFEAALTVQPEFQNAEFFLAQAYAFVGRYADATKLMRDLAMRNPSNEVVRTYLVALEKSINPFATGVVPPADSSSGGLLPAGAR